MKKSLKKLTLNRETIRNLEGLEVGHAVGGVVQTVPASQCNGTCTTCAGSNCLGTCQSCPVTCTA